MDHLKGKTIVLSGIFTAFSRSEASTALEACGARVRGAISGKTDALIMGKTPGLSKLLSAKKHNVLILNEDDLHALLGGLALPGDLRLEEPEKVERQTTPIPYQEEIRNGKKTTYYPGSKQIHIVGEFKAGLREGSWIEYWPNGQMKQNYGWKDGLKEGVERDWKDDGTPLCEGYNEQHLREGKWTFWHSNGEYKQSYQYRHGKSFGDYIWNGQDGKAKARGTFEDGKKVGKWEWWEDKVYHHTISHYEEGQRDGVNEVFYSNGKLAYSVNYEGGYKNGEEVRFYENGKPKSKGCFRFGHPVGSHFSWNEKGTQTEINYKHGIAYASLNLKKVKSLVAKMKKKKDSYQREKLIYNFSENLAVNTFFYYLWKEGFYDITQDKLTWGNLAPNLMTSQDVVLFLTHAVADEEDWSGAFLPYWPAAFDEMVAKAYARNPGPIRDAWDNLPEKNRKGVAFVLARFGVDVGATLAEEMTYLAEKHALHYGLADRILWPNEKGKLVNISLYDQPGRIPNQIFFDVIQLFGKVSEFRNKLKLFTKNKMDEKRFSFSTFRLLVEECSPEDMLAYLQCVHLDGQTQGLVSDALLKWRSDDAEQILEYAMKLNERGLRKWPVVCSAVLALKKEGKEIPEALIEKFELAAESPTYTSDWLSAPLRALPDGLQNNPHHINRVFPFKRGDSVPSMSLMREALEALDEGQQRRIFDRHLEDTYRRDLVAPYLYMVKEPQYLAKVLERLKGVDHPRAIWGFSEVGLAVIPLLEKNLKAAKKKVVKEHWMNAIIFAIARALVDGEEIPEEYDAHIKYVGKTKDHELQFVTPIIERVLYLLPQSRAEKILLRELKSEHFWVVFRAIRNCPSEPVLKAAFLRLLDEEKTGDYQAYQSLESGIKGLGNPKAWVEWIHENGGGAAARVYGNIYGDTLNAFKENLGKKEQKPLDKIEKLQLDCGDVGETIYALRNLEKPKDKTHLNLIGGVAPGVDASRWPKEDDEWMEHKFTLDLDTMPHLKKRFPDFRTMSFFCDEESDSYLEGGATKVLFSTEAEVQKDNAPDVDPRPRRYFEAVELKVDMSNESLRDKVYGLPARVLGDPIWLQGEEGGANFIMQFDEFFCDINLGDMGLMYVFSDYAFWQCH